MFNSFVTHRYDPTKCYQFWVNRLRSDGNEAPALLKPHHQIVLCHISDTRWDSYHSAEWQSVYFTAPADCLVVLQLINSFRVI